MVTLLHFDTTLLVCALGFAHFLIFSYVQLFQITYQYFILVVKDFSFTIFLTMTYFLQQYLIFLNCNLRPIFAVKMNKTQISIFPHIQAVPDGRVSRARFAGLSFDIPWIINMISQRFLFISSHCALYIDLTNIAVSLFTRTELCLFDCLWALTLSFAETCFFFRPIPFSKWQLRHLHLHSFNSDYVPFLM